MFLRFRQKNSVVVARARRQFFEPFEPVKTSKEKS